MAASTNLTTAQDSYQAVFALDVITAAIAIALLALATRPTFKRLRARRFSVPNDDDNNNNDEHRNSPLKTTLGTYLFLYPALLCFLLAYLLQFVQDLLQTAGPGIQYSGALQLGGRRPSNTDGDSYAYGSAVLSFAISLATVFFTTLINGGVWIYSSHVTSNSTDRPSPGKLSRAWNTFIMLAILGTGLAAWGLAMASRGGETATFSQAVRGDGAARVVYVVYRCVVVAASLSVSVEVLRAYGNVRKNSAADSSERPHLARFAMVVVPLIWLRNAFIVYDIVLLYVNTTSWSSAPRVATVFLLIVFGQLANVTILGMILYGAWQTGRTVRVFTTGKEA